MSVDDSFGYKLLDKTKAEYLITKAAAALNSHPLIGSGWDNVMNFDRTKFLVTEIGTYVTDPTYKSVTLKEEWDMILYAYI